MIPNANKNVVKDGKNVSKAKAQEMRFININGVQPKKYTRNYIKTAKYNLYFLCEFYFSCWFKKFLTF